jgi:hypothetical protein
MIEFSVEQIEANHKRFFQIIEDTFDGTRKEKILKMYEHFGDRLVYSPASSFGYFHLSCIGGYIQHVLNVIDTSKKVKVMYEDMGGTIDFTNEELIFAAMHHDLGKLGDLEHEFYVVEDREWQKNTQNRLFNLNPNLKFMEISDRTFFLLQHFDIKYTENEMLGIRLADGVFAETNKPYYMVFGKDKQFRTNIQHVVHWGDWMATRMEVDRWNRNEKVIVDNEKLAVKKIAKPTPKTATPQVKTLMELFDE